MPFKADTTLYVQLVPVMGGKPVLQEKIMLLGGFASGHLYVSNSLPEGDYYLCLLIENCIRKSLALMIYKSHLNI